MKEIATLLTCHDRKEKTINSLRMLFKQSGKDIKFSLSVYLVDDGSTDGTALAVEQEFPEVKIIKGDGNLYWNRGMHVAWKAAATRDYDLYLWLNDDTNLYPCAIEELLSAAKTTDFKAIVCGCIESPTKRGELTYGGGRSNNGKFVANYPEGEILLCDKINGNCVLIPREVFLHVGNLDWRFAHAIGDNDYSLRAKKKGIYSYSTGNFVATCEKHDRLPKWCIRETPLKERLTNLYSPLGYNPPVEFFVFEKRHFGLGIALKHFFSTHLRVLFPGLWS